MGPIGAGDNSGILLKKRDIRDIKDERDRHRNAGFRWAAYVALVPYVAFKVAFPEFSL